MAPEPGGRRTRRLLLLLLIVVAMVGWGAYLAGHLAAARADLQAGMRAAEAAREKVSVADLAEGRAVPDLRRASGLFDKAHRRLTGPSWLPARLLPVVGRQLRSLSALSGAASGLGDAGADAIAETQGLLGGDIGPERRVEVLRQMADIATRTERRLGALRFGPREALLPELARRRNQLTVEVENVRAGLARGSLAGRAVADLLSGPRRYLVFAANNAEMRAGSGMFLSLGELQTDGGDLRLGDMTTVGLVEVPPGGVPLEGDADLAARWAWLRPNEDWRNLMVSPRFDASAALAARMWVAAGQAPVDGVLALDPVALQAILEATGPVTVEDRTIGADEVVEELTHQQYLQLPDDQNARREQLGAIAGAAFDALNGDRPRLTTLASALSRAVRGRHLLAWSARPDEQRVWQDVGVAGDIGPDSLLLSILNRGANKLDRFLDVSAALDHEPAGGETAFSLRVTMANRVTDAEPPYVAGPGFEGGQPGEYLGIFTVNLPGTAVDARIDGVEQLAVAGSDGPTLVVGFQLSVPRGESRTVMVRFRLPGQSGAVSVEPSARVPPVRWSSGGATWADSGPHRLTWRAEGVG